MQVLHNIGYFTFEFDTAERNSDKKDLNFVKEYIEMKNTIKKAFKYNKKRKKNK